MELDDIIRHLETFYYRRRVNWAEYYRNLARDLGIKEENDRDKK